MPTVKKSKDKKKVIQNVKKPGASVLKAKNDDTKKKAKRTESWGRYIYTVLKEIHEDEVRISSKAMLIMNNLMDDIFERLTAEASKLARISKKKTLSEGDIQAAVKLIIPGELSRHSVSEGNKAVKNYFNNC